MRVTQSMMVDNAIKWIQQQSELLSEASEVSAAGKQVNRPSDDPYAAKQILEDRANAFRIWPVYVEYLGGLYLDYGQQYDPGGC